MDSLHPNAPGTDTMAVRRDKGGEPPETQPLAALLADITAVHGDRRGFAPGQPACQTLLCDELAQEVPACGTEAQEPGNAGATDPHTLSIRSESTGGSGSAADPAGPAKEVAREGLAPGEARLIPAGPRPNALVPRPAMAPGGRTSGVRRPVKKEAADPATLPFRRDKSAPSSSPETAAAEPTPAPSEASGETACPRCGSKLINPGSLGWCPNCGYCRSLAEEAPRAALQPTVDRPSPFGVLEFGQVLAKLPHWLWTTLGGIAVIALASFAASLILPREESLARALLSTAELALGLLAVLVAQIWALVLIAPDDDKLGFKDAILSVRLWGLAFGRLPETRRQVWLGAWGAAAVLSALVLVGGFSYWTRFYRPKRVADKGLIQAITQLAEGKGDPNKSLEDAVRDLADSQDLTKPKPENQTPEQDRRPTVQCVILGYTLADKQIESLVVATLLDNRIAFAGVVRRGFNPEASEELLRLLAPLRADKPFLRGVTANLKTTPVWVKPQVFCEVHQSGFNREGILQNPSFAGVLTPER